MRNRIVGKRIFLRELYEIDATDEYCKWLNDPEVNKFLETRSATTADLKTYIKEKNNSPTCLFLGIFDKRSNIHIGNIKLEPIDYVDRIATLGILIGNKDYWGKGIGAESINLLVNWAFNYLHLKEIKLGVLSENAVAIKSYKKCGFIIVGTKSKVRKNARHEADEVLMSIKNPKWINLKVSIVVRSYNSESYIEKCLKSALDQKYPKNDYEIIVINDGSSDRTWVKLRKFQKGKNIFLFDQKNQGPIKTANLGFLLSCGKYVTLLDSDDYYEKNFLNKMVGALEKNKSAEFAYCAYNENFYGKTKTMYPKNIFETIAGGIVFSRKSLIKSRFYNEKVGFAEYDLLLRNLGKWTGIYIPKALYAYNRNPGSLTSDENYIPKWINQLKRLHPKRIDQINSIRKYGRIEIKNKDQLSLRPAQIKDLKFFLNLRNLPNVRKWSFNNKVVNLIDHKAWFTKKLASADSLLFVLEKGSVRLGQVRIDITGSVGEIDVAILPKYRKKGYGNFLIHQACLSAFDKFKNLKKIEAYIKIINRASKLSFLKAGFVNSGVCTYKNFQCFKLEFSL